MRIRTLIELVRAPAALTIPGDVAAGAASRHSPRCATAGLVLSSCCLYWAGMALNDYADREVDAAQRPGRPIPSGRVPANFALGLSISLTGLAAAIAASSGGGRALRITLPLAGTVWGYNLGLKNTPAGPATMAAARALDVLHGAGPDATGSAARAAVTVGAHTFAVSTVGRDEVTGASRRVPATALVTTLAVISATLASGRRTAAAARSGRALTAGRPTALAALAVYAATTGTTQLSALREPSASRLQRATGAGILGMIPLQAALTAAGGAPRGALAVLAVFPLTRRLFGRVSPT